MSTNHYNLVTEERQTTTKVQRYICKDCGVEVSPSDLNRHHVTAHTEAPKRSGDFFYFETQEQGKLWLPFVAYMYARLVWSSPGWYGLSDHEYEDSDGDKEPQWKHIDKLREEHEAEIARHTTEIAAIEALPHGA